MARKNVSELQDAVVNTLAEHGPVVEFSTLTSILAEDGNGEAIPLLRKMKHEGRIAMRLERGPNGLVHQVTLPNEGIPF